MLRRGWTTGTCATAAAKAAATALLGGGFPDPVEITLPGGARAAFALAETRLDADAAMVGIVKDAGDDPDVTHGALIRVTVRHGAAGSGVLFRAGPGVGTVTRPGLALPPGEPAINPVPRQMIRAALAEACGAHPADLIVEIGVDGGEALAERTLNGRLGIVGGLSILGTTGIVVPYSCAAWIDSIHRGIDVARAIGLDHVAGATGRSSEAAVRALHGLADTALLEMGDFVGGMLKYLRRHPVARISVAGGVAKMTKLAQGRLDLHSRRGSADLSALAALAARHGADAATAERIAAANSVAEAFDLAGRGLAGAGQGGPDLGGPDLGGAIAADAWSVASQVLRPAACALEILVFDRQGALVGRAPFADVNDAHAGPPDDAGAGRKRRR